MRKPFVLLMVFALLGAMFASADAGAAGVRARAMKQRLKPFPSCQRLVGYAHRYTKRELRGGGGIFAPAPQPIDNGTRAPSPNSSAGGDAVAPEGATPTTGDSSGTNTQEVGVDEPDIVKTDGTHIFALSGNRLNVIDARADTPKLLDSLELESYGGDLLLQGRRLLVISYSPSPLILPPQGGGPQPARGAQVATEPGIAYPYREATLITEVDVSDPTALKVVRTETIDGSYVSARQNGAIARIVLNTPPVALDSGSQSLRRSVRGWVPRARLENKLTGRKRTRRITACTQVRRPRIFSGLDVLTVLTVDMRKGLPAVDTDALMTDGQTVYASNGSLYVATQKFVGEPSVSDQPPPPLNTAIHRFDISDGASTVYRSSGEVPGYVLGQFALSEYKGVLRVASTDSPVWWPGGSSPEVQSYVSTLKESDGLLLPLGRVGGLGKGERIVGVRFLDEAGYVVTFRQTDPLYTIDLSEPNAPRVAGELKLLGFSAYLHPVGDGLLLGVGQDATTQGRQLGTQLSLFDVSNLARPQRLSQARVGGSSSSEVEYDHHAFLYWGPTKLAVIPVYLYDGSNPFTGAIGYRIGQSAIDEVGRISHQGQQYASDIRRSVVIGDRLFTISDLGAKSSSLSTLADEAFVEFPQPPQQGCSPGGSGGAEQQTTQSPDCPSPPAAAAR